MKLPAYSALVAAMLSVSVLLTACSDNDDDTVAVTPVVVEPTPKSISLTKIGRFETNLFEQGAAEITAYDAASKRLFVVNASAAAIDVIDLKDPTKPTKVGMINASGLGAGINSVAVRDGIVAAAVEATVKQDNGLVVFYKASDLTKISQVSVGALPDMLTFSPDGKTVLVANEGEPNAAYTVDPEGSISVINVSDISKPTAKLADFKAFNGKEADLRSKGIRIYGLNASAAQDFEPEYITVSSDNKTAWVALQENNAIAVVDLATAKVTAVQPLGYKDHGKAGQGIDASDRDNAINIKPWANVLGMYQPDAIANYQADGQTYLVAANEGDSRSYDGFSEESRAKDLLLDPAVFTDAACGGVCRSDALLGRLTVTNTLGFTVNTAGQKVYNKLYALGGRSFSIHKTDGSLVFDSGDQLEKLVAQRQPNFFNSDHAANALDNRSDNKGPEPEGLALGKIGSKTFAFIGLERDSGVVVYDISKPTAPTFVDYINTRDFTRDTNTSAAGDLGPEGVAFVSAKDSPNGKPLLVVGYEISGSTVVFQINQTF